MDVRTTQTSGMINTGGIAINIYTPPDNGGDVSAIWLHQTGGGNALSVYNLSANRPNGYQEYNSQGYAIEATVDGSKHVYVPNGLSAIKGGVFGLSSVLGQPAAFKLCGSSGCSSEWRTSSDRAGWSQEFTVPFPGSGFQLIEIKAAPKSNGYRAGLYGFIIWAE